MIVVNGSPFNEIDRFDSLAGGYDRLADDFLAIKSERLFYHGAYTKQILRHGFFAMLHDIVIKISESLLSLLINYENRYFE